MSQLQFFTAAQLATMQLPDLPTDERSIQRLIDTQNWRTPTSEGIGWRKRQGRGGGFEYSHYPLPRAAAIELLLRTRQSACPHPVAAAADAEKRGTGWLWEEFDRQSDKKKAEAMRRLDILVTVRQVGNLGHRTKLEAIRKLGPLLGFAQSSFYEWEELTLGYDQRDWLPLLVSEQRGGGATAQYDPAAWDHFTSLYLSLSKPTLEWCFRQTQKKAAEQGWTLCSLKTFQRRLALIPLPARVLARDGESGLRRLLPQMERDRSVFHALEAVNADGHRFDVFVRWPDGTVGRPVMCAFQDLYSGLLLSWRVDKTENKDAVRLAFGDMVETYGIPDDCWLDNGRNFASKWLTGGIANRYRFKVREEEPEGILKLLGVRVHWTKPYNGQAKPIERAFRDLAHDVARNPLFEGAYTGNSPMAKPENYGTKAIPIETFLRVLHEGIVEHNQRTGRLSRVCGGTRSFWQVFQASYEASPIRRAAAEQRRLWLLAAEQIRTHSENAQIELLGNRYWTEKLWEVRGQRVVVRFDPQDLHAGVHVYRATGEFLCEAPVLHAVGFADTDASREHNRRLAEFKRATREMLAAERKLTPEQALSASLQTSMPVPPEAKVVRPFFAKSRGNTALKISAEEHAEAERAMLDAIPPVVPFPTRPTLVPQED